MVRERASASTVSEANYLPAQFSRELLCERLPAVLWQGSLRIGDRFQIIGR